MEHRREKDACESFATFAVQGCKDAEQAVNRAEERAEEGRLAQPDALYETYDHARLLSAYKTLRTAHKTLEDERDAKRTKFEVDTVETLACFKLQLDSLTSKATTNPGLVGQQVMDRSDFYDGEQLLVSAFEKVDVSAAEAWLLDALPEHRDWETLAGLERLAVNEEIRSERLRRAPVPVIAVTGNKESVLQYGKNYLLRQLKKFSGFRTSYRDTRCGGLTNSNDRPDHSYLASYTSGLPVVSYLMFLFVGEDKYQFSTRSFKQGLGELTTKLRKILDCQMNRHFVYGYIMDKQSIKFGREGGVESFWWTREYPFALQKENYGFRLWLKMLFADEDIHGFQPPLPAPSIETSNGMLCGLGVLNMKQTQMPPTRGCVVYAGQLQGVHVAVKMGPIANIQPERITLAMLTEKNVRGVLPLLADGKTADGDGFIVTRLCNVPGFNMRGRDYVDMLEQVGETLEEMQGHTDLSPDNIVYDSEGFYLIDFGSAVVSGRDLPRTGTTRPFTAVSVMAGVKVSLSSELETLMLVLVHYATCGKTPWCKKFTDEDSENSKVATFSRKNVFQRDVLGKCTSPVLKALMVELRDLFWEPQYKGTISYENFYEAVRKAVGSFSDEELDQEVLST